MVKAHRGAAFADFDGSGRIGIIVSALGEKAELWKNTAEALGNWVEFRLEGTRSNRDAIGSVIRVDKQWNQMTSAVGYALSSLCPVHFGRGSAAELNDVEIQWPSGRTQRLNEVLLNQLVNVKEPDN
jgi:hypothetical protein